LQTGTKRNIDPLCPLDILSLEILNVGRCYHHRDGRNSLGSFFSLSKDASPVSFAIFALNIDIFVSNG
jgi:hypothetical protein